ncbi:MAG: phage tail protein [Proteobacteria bacterium]|nr:phage tail protein [Pseudomonadota bacterium]
MADQIMNSFGFKVLFDSNDDMGGLFQEVSGLSIQVNVTDLQEGGENTKTHKLVEGVTFSNVTLKRGMCGVGMYSWIDDVRKGNVSRKTIRIQVLGDKKDEVVKTYVLDRAIPVKWDGPSLNVMQDSIATESLELAHEGLTVE